ncbi:autolysin [Staphylococcus schleiferi subsp. coagulans]|uniref:N-acetylglucosaminidase n=1 Tax=Staphylococcus coagulans TaxID=74706 RepID=UPI0015FA50E4|nr:N-acetylglucosaminidase [Staphylococcus coagulans]MBA8760272.1 autolysin [Staphylococcus coagulans]MBA8769004.1 autolysin [Staphylococcus coagulans]
MKRFIKEKPSRALLILILTIFAILLLINETSLFKNDKTHTFSEAYDKQVKGEALHTKSESHQFVKASHQDIKNAMEIKRKDSDLMYMDLSEAVQMSEKEVNQMLKGKGILEGQGKAFLDAQNKYDVNVIYLISHAQLETGEGKSELAQGVKSGKKKYFNFFGIGAFDSDAVKTGSSYAQKANWTSPRQAIMGGAKFVRQNYFENGQLNLYQMRWNPKQPATNQYASDIDWARKIAERMSIYYEHYGVKKDDIRKDFYQKG